MGYGCPLPESYRSAIQPYSCSAFTGLERDHLVFPVEPRIRDKRPGAVLLTTIFAAASAGLGIAWIIISFFPLSNRLCRCFSSTCRSWSGWAGHAQKQSNAVVGRSVLLFTPRTSFEHPNIEAVKDREPAQIQYSEDGKQSRFGYVRMNTQQQIDDSKPQENTAFAESSRQQARSARGHHATGCRNSH